MNWKTKARITRCCARVPKSERCYRFIQKHFGRLSDDPQSRLNPTVALVAMLRKHQRVLAGRYVEVGTGHVPVVPVGLFLAGAREVWTYDLNRRLDPEMTLGMLAWLAEHGDHVTGLFSPFADSSEVKARLGRLRGIKDVAGLLEVANIRYVAPADAARTGLPDRSVDCHFSVTTLEHVAPEALIGVFREARRILAPGGVAIHLIDPSDHFQHTDASITKINFLRFTETDWRSIAGNHFAYCNRLRASDYARLFSEAGFSIADEQRVVDQDGVALLQRAFPVDVRFSGYTDMDLCTTEYTVALT
jgi:SAM-dependent methyltransferase